MALTKIGKEGITGISNSADATFLTVDSSEQAVIKSEGGAVTTSVQQGLGKMFCNFDGTASGATVRDSFNVSSTDDDGTGDYGINYTNNMGNTNYAGIVVGKQDGAGNNNAIAGTTRTSNDTPTLAASLEIVGTDPDAGADRDYEFVYATSMGDLA
tara:strand:+ start:76 stop:543 length:468 start_codon:yes stop_codon:yes gene_type:complete